MKTEISRDSHQLKKRYSGVYQQQGRMLTDADWNELVEILKDRLNDALKDVVGSKEGGIGGTPRHRALKVIKASSDPLTIQPGHVYVNGVAAEVPGDREVSYDAQPDFPGAPNLPTALIDSHVLYADVWERTVTHLMDERLRDKGLHGADTCTRKQMMAQVKWCPFGVDPEQWTQNPPKGDAELTVTLLQKTTESDPCDPCAAQLDMKSKVGNYLFRVEVHDVKGDADDPSEITLKWSSENGAEQFEALPTKEKMPAGFISDKWVYEFFDKTSEKHLGVHLENTTWEPARVGLTAIKEPASPYNIPTIPGSSETRKFVRRWDGYATFKWDALNAQWRLHSGISGGVDLTEDSSSTKGVKVLKLDSLELKLQLLNRVVSGPVTLDSLSGTPPVDLIIDGIEIGSANSSAMEKAAAINNANTSVTAVTATANTVLEGSAPSKKGKIDAGQLKVNSVDIGEILSADSVETQVDVVINAINTKFSSDADFTASKTLEGAIVLTAADGRNIEVEVADIKTSRRCGFEQGANMYYGCITLTSPLNSDITVIGEHPEYAGFIAGTTRAVQFVVGDYWLAEVREIEHKAGSVLIRDKAPQGIDHHYLTLGTVINGVLQPNPEEDRKYAFPPLTEMTRMFHVGGDGQEAMPGHQLPYPIQVGIANGEWPVTGAKVRFSLASGDGELSLSEAPFTSAELPVVVVSADGLATCYWKLGSGVSPHSKQQRLKTELLGVDENPSTPPPVYFNANLSTADQVAYDNPACAGAEPTVNSLLQDDSDVQWPDLDGDNDITVKDVLDAVLCNLRARHIPFYPVDCSSGVEPTVKSGLDVNANTNLNDVVQKLLCEFNATHLPVDRNDLCVKLEGLQGNDKVNTVQDAINALCRMQGGGCCTITISPGDDLEARLKSEIPKGGDAHICITVGEYIVNNPVVLIDLGNITIEGCGDGTIIRSPNSESAMTFIKCKSVVVRDLSIKSYRVGKEKGSEFEGLNGALTIRNVKDVVVESVAITCGAGAQRMASCLTVSHEYPESSSVRVRSCLLKPGHQQVGILLVNADRARIEDNDVKVAPKPSKLTLRKLLKDKKYLMTLRKIMLSDVVAVQRNTPLNKKRNVKFKYERMQLCFNTHPDLIKTWHDYLDNLVIEEKLNNVDLVRYMKALTDKNIRMLASAHEVALPADISAFLNWFNIMKQHLPAIASQGIVCAGRIANDICITKNSISGVAQGIHIGLSYNNPESENDETYIAGRLLVEGNHIVNYLSLQDIGESHGMFVGNFKSLHVENNHLKLEKYPYTLKSSINGVRVYGYFGGMMQIRGNRLDSYDPGIFARSINAGDVKSWLWQVENNLLSGASDVTVLEPLSKFIEDHNKA